MKNRKINTIPFYILAQDKKKQPNTNMHLIRNSNDCVAQWSKIKKYHSLKSITRELNKQCSRVKRTAELKAKQKKKITKNENSNHKIHWNNIQRMCVPVIRQQLWKSTIQSHDRIFSIVECKIE